jgi:hypothetical protein
MKQLSYAETLRKEIDERVMKAAIAEALAVAESGRIEIIRRKCQELVGLTFGVSNTARDVFTSSNKHLIKAENIRRARDHANDHFERAKALVDALFQLSLEDQKTSKRTKQRKQAEQQQQLQAAIEKMERRDAETIKEELLKALTEVKKQADTLFAWREADRLKLLAARRANQKAAREKKNGG